MNYTDLDGNKTNIHTTVDGTASPVATASISQTGAIRDFKGVLQDWAAGKGAEFAATTTDPIQIPLEDNEQQANFKVRIVGPGKPVSAAMTSAERERWLNVSLKTALFDFLMPVVLKRHWP